MRLATVLVSLLAVVFVVSACAKKEEAAKPAEKKEEVKKEAAKPAEAPAEAPKAEEAKPAEAPAEAPKAEEAKPAEAPAEAPKAEEAKPAEAPAEAPKAEEAKPAEAPAAEAAPAAAPAEVKLVDIDLSTAIAEVPILLSAPEGATAKEDFGAIKVALEPAFKLQFSKTDSPDMAGRKKEIGENTLNKLKQYVVDLPEAILYESEVMGTAEFHFYAIVKVGEATYQCEDEKGPVYTKEQAEAMLKSCQSAKAKP